MKLARTGAAIGVAAALAASAYASGTGAPRPVSSLNPGWGGYVVTDLGGGKLAFTSVSATWTQPKMACGEGQRDALGVWVGLGGYGAEGLEQAGVGTTCTKDAEALSTPWYEILPAYATTIKRRHVEPGDTISASVDVSKARTSVRFSIENHTQGWRVVHTVPVSSPDLSSAEWIVEAPRGCDRLFCSLRLGNFRAVTLTRVSVVANGHRGTILDGRWQATALQLVPSARHAARSGSTAGAAPEALSAGGESFRVAWLANAAAATAPPAAKPQNPLIAAFVP